MHTAHGAAHASAVAGMRPHMPHNNLPSLHQPPCALSTCCVLQGLTKAGLEVLLGFKPQKADETAVAS